MSQAMLAGIPQVLMPLAHDQFDNGARVKRLGIGEAIPSPKFTANRLTHTLARLLNSSDILNRCREIANRVSQMDGISRSADAIEARGTNIETTTLTSRGPHIVVSAIILDEDNRLFLAMSPKWRNQWAIPGGKVQYGESLLQALQRELKEETGLDVLQAKLLRMSESICEPSFGNGKSHLLLLDYVVQKFAGRVQLDPRELAEYQWVPAADALNLELTPPTRESILFLCENT